VQFTRILAVCVIASPMESNINSFGVRYQRQAVFMTMDSTHCVHPRRDVILANGHPFIVYISLYSPFKVVYIEKIEKKQPYI